MAIPVSLRGTSRHLSFALLRGRRRMARRLGAFGAGGHLRWGDPHRARGLAAVTLQIIRDWVMRFNERGAAGLLTANRRSTLEAQ